MWRYEILYVLDTPVPSCDKDVCVAYQHDDGREVISRYSMLIVRYPDLASIEAFVLSEVERLEAEDAANKEVVE